MPKICFACGHFAVGGCRILNLLVLFVALAEKFIKVPQSCRSLWRKLMIKQQLWPTVRDSLPELHQLELLLRHAPAPVSARMLAMVPLKGQQLPIYAVSVGQARADKPVLLLSAGIHGLERIGTQVLLAYLESLCSRLSWDRQFATLFDRVQLYMLPLLNPAGMALGWRANARHVDLMRNAPQDCPEGAAFLVGGQRFSHHLPWFRGSAGELETESQALVDFVSSCLFPAPFSLVLDCHSGFGRTDRLWFPYAKSSTQPIAHLAQIHRLRELLFQTYPHQNYIFEPQSRHYLCHGDLWDHLFDLSLQQPHLMLPLTLEMGSWNWVRKNPFQLLKSHGLFHPMKPHRVKRVLRSHLILFEFLLQAAAASADWLGSVDSRNAVEANALWYDR
jgi:hypothetical protein